MGRWAIFNTLLGIIVLLLGVEIARTWARALPAVDLSARPVEDAPKGASGPREGRGRGKRNQPEKAAPSPATMVATVVNKDLFDPSRQKAQEEVKVAGPKEAAPPPNLTLNGVRILGKDVEAFVTDATAGNQQKRLRVGDQVGGYTVKTVEPRRVTLANTSGDVVKLDLAVEKGGGAAAPAPGVRPGVPPRPPGAPPVPGVPMSTAAGISNQPSPAAGVQPRVPRPPTAPVPGQPVPPRPGVGMPGAPGVPGMPTPPPNLPAGVREKLEQLKAN